MMERAAIRSVNQAGTSRSSSDVEYGRNTELSSIEAIAKALGLKLELVEA
jgi:hypothetical protein